MYHDLEALDLPVSVDVRVSAPSSSVYAPHTTDSRAGGFAMMANYASVGKIPIPMGRSLTSVRN